MNIFHIYARKSLMKNKTRTLVTIVGIILSVSMITAVTTLVSTIRAYGISYVTATKGNWHVYTGLIEDSTRQNLYAKEQVKNVYELQYVGYAKFEESEDSYKPYLCVQAMNRSFEENMPITLTQGRLPENDREVILPDTLRDEAFGKYQMGDTMKLQLGYRESKENNQKWMGQETSLLASGEDEHTFTCEETLVTEFECSYKVVGFYESDRASFTDSYSSPGYTVLTLEGEGAGYPYYACYLLLNSPSDSLSFLADIADKDAPGAYSNTRLLQFYGISANQSVLSILYGMGGILTVIIIVGSVALIYNVFAISISERTRQFGLLSSIGATRKQMKKTICYEALVLCLFGIPLGVIAGMFGIGVTLAAIKEPLENYLGKTDTVSLSMHVSWLSIGIAVVISIFTVLISAYLPMQRALRISAIDAIKQRKDITLQAKQVKIPHYVPKLFGVEGMIAWKNYKRNKKQYRATVFSISLSIVLFITAGSFTEYLLGSFSSNVTISNCDLEWSVYDVDNMSDADGVCQKMNQMDGVTPVWTWYNSEILGIVPETSRSEENLKTQKENQIELMQVQFVPDEAFAEIIKTYNLEKKKYEDLSVSPGIVLNLMHNWNTTTQTYDVCTILKEDVTELMGVHSEDTDALYEGGQVKEQNGEVFLESEKEDGKKEWLPLSECQTFSVEVGDILNTDYINVMCENGKTFSTSTDDYMKLLYPVSARDTVLKTIVLQGGITVAGTYMAQNHKQAYEEMQEALKDSGWDYYLTDMAQWEEQDRATLMMVRVFCYGFIVLISLIAAANVFNTISTNMNLRRREFAMLKSFGMSEKGFVRMLNYECLLYGIRGLLYGLSLAVVLTMFMYYFANGQAMKGFFIPLSYFVIVIVCVFIIVYATMLYGRIKLRRNNIVETLKNE